MWRAETTGAALLGAALALSVAARLVLAAGYPALGDDTGTYLASMHFATGTDQSGSAFLRPPLVGYYLVPFTHLFGDLPGAKLAAIVASLLPAVPFYLLVRRILRPAPSAALSLLLVWAPPYADMLAWGFLTFLAIAAGLLSFHFMLKAEEAPERATTHWALAAATGAIVFYTNQTAVPVYLLIAGVYALLSLRSPRTVGPILTGAALGLVLSLSAVPYYIHHVSTGAATMGAIVVKDPLALATSLLWAGGLAAAGFRLGGPVGRLIVAMATAALLQAFTSPDSLGLMTVLGRSARWAYVPVILVLAWGCRGILARWLTTARLQAAGLAALVLFAGTGWAVDFSRAAAFYITLTPDALAAVRWVEGQTGPGSVVAAHPSGLAWYVEGLANRPAVQTFPVWADRAIRGSILAEDRAVRCLLGYTTLPWVQDCDPAAEARRLGIDYLLVGPSSGIYYQDPNLATRPWWRHDRAEAPNACDRQGRCYGEQVFTSGPVRVFAVGREGVSAQW